MAQAKILIVGDGAIGKTRLIECFTNDGGEVDWDEAVEYEPTTFNNFTLDWKHAEKGPISIEMWDTAGQEAFEQLRKLSYPGTDIFLIGYNCNSRESLSNIPHKWLPEIQESDEDPWFILVGTKCDLEKKASEEEVEANAKDTNACAIIETSAKTKIGIDDLIYKVQMLAFYKHDGNPRPKYGEESKWNDKVQGAAPEAKPVSVKENQAFEGNAEAQAQITSSQQSSGSPASKPAAAAKPATAAKPAAAKPAAPPPKPSGSGNSGKQTQGDDSGCSCVVA